MRLIDEQYTATLSYGARRMAASLRQLGHPVGRRRVRRLMRLMGLAAIYPMPLLSRPSQDAERYPYLGIRISRDGKGRALDNIFVERFGAV